MEFDKSGQRKHTLRVLCKYMNNQNEDQSDFISAPGVANEPLFAISPAVSISTDLARFR